MGSIKPEIFVIRLNQWSSSNNMTSVLGFLSHFHDNKFKFSAHQEKYLHIEDMSRRQIQAGIEFIENQRVFLTTRGTTANQVNVYHSAPSMSQVMFNQYHHNHKDIKL
jgi:hypothetical protein